MLPKFHSKLTPWTGGHFSPAGRQVVIQSIASAIPHYWTSHQNFHLWWCPRCVPSHLGSFGRGLTYHSCCIFDPWCSWRTPMECTSLDSTLAARRCAMHIIFRLEERISTAGERNPIYTWGRPPMLSVQTSKGYWKPFIWPLRIHSQSLDRFASVHNNPYHSWDIQPWIGRLMVYMEGTQSLYISASSSASSSYLYENHAYALWVELNLKYFPDNVLYRYLDEVVTKFAARANNNAPHSPAQGPLGGQGPSGSVH